MPTCFTLSKFTKLMVVTFAAASIGACSSSDDDDDNVGYIKFFNASSNAPAIFLSVDEDLDNDDDDEIEATFSAISFPNAGSRIELTAQDYFVELGWQDEDSSARSDLELLYQQQLDVNSDSTLWVVMSGSVETPIVTTFEIEDRDEDEIDDDADLDVSNLRLLNLHPDYSSLDVYISDSDETFAEAEFLDTGVLTTISENSKIAQDQYIVYLTESGAQTPLFTSNEMTFSFNAQYVIAIRENQGSGGSDFVIDQITNSSITEFADAESLAKVAVFNGLSINEYSPDYAATFDLKINGETVIPEIESLAFGQFSDSYSVESGDYRFTVVNDVNEEALLENRLLSLPQNTSKSLFLYWTEEAVDDDGDGIVDENEDGIIDEIRAIVTSLVVDNSELQRLYDKQLTLLNLVQTDDFSSVTVYFVKSDEIIATTSNLRRLAQGVSTSITLLNNTYQVFAVAEIDGNDIIIDEFSMTLEEESADKFLLLEHDDSRPSGFRLQLIDQVAPTDD